MAKIAIIGAGQVGASCAFALAQAGLAREIALVDPQCVVTLGNVPLRAVCEKRLTIGEVHGQLLAAQGRPLFPLYHPASVIYNPALRQIYAADVASLARWLAEGKI